MRRVALIKQEQEVDNIQESFQSTILEVLTDRDEESRNLRRNTSLSHGNSILTIKTRMTRIRLNTSLASLLAIRSTIQCLQRERGQRRNISAESSQESLKVSSISKLLEQGI